MTHVCEMSKMQKEEYLEMLLMLWESGKISDAAYDQAVSNMEEFTE